jgi:predicted protein tyrosine phosphatase
MQAWTEGRARRRLPGMTSSLVPFPIHVCGIEELEGHCATGVSHVLSILDPDRAEPEAFGQYGEHARLELRFHDIIEDQPDQVAPGPEQVAAILEFGRGLLAEPAARLLVHCHVGISRSTAAMSLILAQARPEAGAEEVLQGVLAIREKTWPNLRMLEMGDAILGRGGSLPRAAAAIYRHQLAIRPHLAEVMRKAGRGREVDAAEALA